MRFGRVPIVKLLVCLLFAGLPSCISHHIAIARKGGGTAKNGTAKKLLVADQSSLIDIITRQYNAVRNFSAQVDMAALVGSFEEGEEVEYRGIRAYLYFRRPANLHLLGLIPVIRTTAFDMVSTGPTFKLYVPKDNSFTVGSNDVEALSDKKLENLRPQHFLDAIRVRPVDLTTDKVLTENLTDEEYFYYILHLIHEDNAGHLTLTRSIWFNRQDLTLARQMTYDAVGNIVSDVRYSDWHPFDNVLFPKHIEIYRPREGYGATIDIVKMDINKGVSDDKFVLDQPEGTVLKTIGPKPKDPRP